MLTGVAYGQLYQAMPQPGYGPVKAFWIDSVLSIPTNVTSGTNLSGGRDVGKIRYNIPDSSLQAWTGYQWRSGGSGTTPTWQDSLFFNQSTLSQFNIKFAQVAHGFANSKCHIVLGPGDSNTDRPEVFNLRLRGLLENYGKVDPGWCGFNPNQYPTYGILREVTAGWTKNDLATPGMSLNIDDIVSNDNTQYVQFETTTFGTTFDSLTIYFYKTASSGSFSVQVDAGTPDTVSTTGADVAGKYSLTGMSNAAHTITIRPVADGAVRMLGAYAYSSDASFVISKVAHSGASSINFADAPVTWDYIFQDMHPDLAILNIGTNDMTYDSTSADYLINLETIIDRIRTNNEFISIAILAPSDNGLTTVEPKINYIESAFSAANNKSVALGSLYKFWGDYDNALNNSVFFDQVHFNYTFADDGNIKFIGSLLGINTQVDSTIFATVTTLADTASALRALISGVAIGSTVTSATAGSIFYAGTGGKLQQSNTKFFFDSTNVRMSIGHSSPGYEIDVKKTVNGSVGAAIINESGGTSGAARFDIGRSFGGDYYGTMYYAGDGNTIFTPLTFNILASASTEELNINHTGNKPMNFLTNNLTRLQLSGAGNLIFGGGATAPDFRFLEPSGSGSNYTGFKAPTLAGNTIYTLPTAFPAGNDYLLKSSTAGVLEFTSPTSLPYIALTGTSILTGATTVDINDNDFTISDAGSGSHNILLSANTGQSEITIDGLNKSITLNATNNTIVTSPGVQFSAYGAGALTTDGSGNITPVSDRNAKHNIQSFNYGLNSILGLKTSSFIYNQDKSNTLMSGFIAQDVQRVIPIAVHKGKDGMLSLETNAILAALVNSVKELKELNDKQQKEINNLKQIIKNK